MAADPADALGYSQTQFYRRVRLLASARLIQPERGRHNQIILSEQDLRVLREFCTIELNYAEHSLEWCLEHLRAQILEKQLETVTGQANYLRAENTGLRKALVTYRRWTIRRVLDRIKNWFSPRRTE